MFAMAANALHIPANVALERHEALLCDQASSCPTLFRRAGHHKKPRVIKERPVAKTPEDLRKEANVIFHDSVKNHVLYGKNPSGKEEDADKGRHTVSSYCKAHPKATGLCSKETHLCFIQQDGKKSKSLWDDRDGGHTDKAIETQCTNAIMHSIKNPGKAGYVVKAGNHLICINYTSGKKGASGTCYHKGVNPAVPKSEEGDVCANTGATATNKDHRSELKC